jgi:hypothetical protein
MTTIRKLLIETLDIEEGNIQNLELIETIKEEILPKYHPYLNPLISYLTSDAHLESETEENNHRVYILFSFPMGWLLTSTLHDKLIPCSTRIFKWKELPFIEIDKYSRVSEYSSSQLVINFFKYIFVLGIEPEFASYYDLSTELNWTESGNNTIGNDASFYTCDHCGNSIIGNGYHCTICYNVDICQQCYSNTFDLVTSMDLHRRHHHLQEVRYYLLEEEEIIIEEENIESNLWRELYSSNLSITYDSNSDDDSNESVPDINLMPRSQEGFDDYNI